MATRKRRSPKGFVRSREQIKLSIMGMVANRRRAKGNARKAVTRRGAQKKRAYQMSRSRFVRTISADKY
jgi:hypothetical protein